jgi:hypothetical protein
MPSETIASWRQSRPLCVGDCQKGHCTYCGVVFAKRVIVHIVLVIAKRVIVHIVLVVLTICLSASCTYRYRYCTSRYADGICAGLNAHTLVLLSFY